MTSKSTVPKKQPRRKQKFSAWHIVLFTALLLVILVVLFPEKLLISALINNPHPSQLSVIYLRNLVALQPKNSQLILALAEQELKLGNVSNAADTIAPYISSTPQNPAQWQALWIHYQITRIQTFALPEKSPQRLAGERKLGELLAILAKSPHLTASMLDNLAQDALALNEVQVALTLYKTAEKFPNQKSAKFYARVGEVALFVSDYQSSAEFYLLAMQKSTSIDDRRKYFIAAVKALMAGSKFTEAIQFSEKNIDGLNKDRATLFFLANMAMSANKLDAAQRYIKQALNFKSAEIHDVAKDK